jgi:hypothetical protein
MNAPWPAPAAPPLPPRSRVGGVVLAVIGSVLALVALGLLVGGGVLMWANQTQRNGSGYLTTGTAQLSTSSYAIATTNLDIEFSGHGWAVSQDALGKVRITAASTSPAGIFIGVAPSAAVLRYLAGVNYAQITGVQFSPYHVTSASHSGGAPEVPTSQTVWQAHASGTGTESLTWTVASGEWGFVIMNADASPGVFATVSVGATAPFLFAIAFGLLIGGGIILILAVILLTLGIVQLNRFSRGEASAAAPTMAAGPPSPSPPPFPVGPLPLRYPLRIEGRLDEPLSPWLWLVKWLLLIPHYVVLAFLFVGMYVLTVIAFFAILFTGRYPRGIFDFNLGVLRWAWRVGFYGYNALGTDHYPPFTLDAEAGYPATLDLPYPERLSRGLVLIKWWLLAVPQYIIVAVLGGGAAIALHGWGLIAILVLIAAVAVLFTRRYPRGVFDLVMGFNRWVFRVLTYALLMRDEYPPFRLDQGGPEPPPAPSPAPSPAPAAPGLLPHPPPA